MAQPSARSALVLEGVERVTYERDWLGTHVVTLEGGGGGAELRCLDPFSRIYKQRTRRSEEEAVAEKLVGADRVIALRPIDQRREERLALLLTTALMLSLVTLPVAAAALTALVLWDLWRAVRRVRVSVNGRYLGCFERLAVWRGSERAEYRSLLELLR